MTDIEHIANSLDECMAAIPFDAMQLADNEIGGTLFDIDELRFEDTNIEPVRAVLFTAMQSLSRARVHLENGYADISDYRALMVGNAGLQGVATDSLEPQPAGIKDTAPDVAAARSGDVRHVRPEPTAWRETLEFAKGLIDPNAPHVRTKAMVDTLLGRIDQLDNESLEELRYYGLGLIMCGIAQKLYDPETRAEVIRSGASGFYMNWLSGSTARGTLLIKDIRTTLVRSSLNRMVEEGTRQLPVEVHLLNDALLVSSTVRESAINEPNPGAHYNPAAKFCDKRGIVKPGAAARFTGDQALAGAGASVRVILSKHEQYLNKKDGFIPPDPEAYDDPDYTPDEAPPRSAVEVLDSATEEDLGLVRIAQRLAALRRDEFTGYTYDYIDVDNAGRTIFLSKKVVPSSQLPPSPVRIDDPAVLHRKRLQCPALFVERLSDDAATQRAAKHQRTSSPTERLIPTVVDLVVAMIRGADQLVKDRAAQNRRQSGY